MTNYYRFLSILSLALAFVVASTTALQSQQSTTKRPQQSIATTPVVICPGFGNDQIDYSEPLSQPKEFGLVAALERRGFNPDLIRVIPVQRKDWFRVAGGLLDWKFYTNAAQPTGGGYGWYLERFYDTVNLAYKDANANDSQEGGDAGASASSSRVLVIGHSAGGWLARAAMGDGVWSSAAADKDTSDGPDTRTADRICGLVTVGAIHKPPVSIASCVTRGVLAYTDQEYPGAFLQPEGVGYVSVGGGAIVGDNTRKSQDAKQQQQQQQPDTGVDADSDADALYATRGEGSAARVAYNSYEAVCGRGDVTGDGVVPLAWTQLEGSKQLQLDGVLHSINEAGTTIPTDRWYGSEAVIDRWLPTVLQEAGISTAGGSGTSSTISSGSNPFDMAGLQKWASGVLQQQ